MATYLLITLLFMLRAVNANSR